MSGNLHNDSDNFIFQVDIPMSVLYKCASSMDSCDVSSLDKKWEFLQNVDLVSDDGAFILGVNGVLTETELEIALKVGNLPAGLKKLFGCPHCPPLILKSGGKVFTVQKLRLL